MPIERGASFRMGRRFRALYSLGGEAAPATASALHVRIVELETRAVEPFDVVDFGAVEILEAERVDIEVDAVRLERLVHVGRLVFEVEVVRKARAPAAHDS